MNEHNCDENIESNMTPAHCSECGKDMSSTMNDIENRKIEDLVSALKSMYEQYCQDGHYFMSAGEEAMDVLDEYGYGSFDGAGRIMKWLTPTEPLQE